MTGGVVDTYDKVREKIGAEIHTPTINARQLATAAQQAAGTALSAAQAAVNTAANAGEKADIAYANANDWQLEFAHSSAEVTKGTGEVMVGPMLNVRDGQLSILTDIHVALLEQHGGLTFETRVWNMDKTAYRVAHTAVIDPNVTIRNFSALTVPIYDLERFWAYVLDIIGSAPPTVLQICAAGVFIEDPEFA
ncbi:hypothetical protein [Nocardia sp. BSTN01]|uniref:hypothetical protein n=1 Tax=Nocardia sp. BSTN01 TaxID=2783665 RepID=UPI001E577F16|nr:hypothetical protein [Nocardia sp. BSTN01]